MRRSILTGSTAICLCVGLSAPLLADTAAPAKVCLGDLAAFQAETQKDGYWLGSGGYGYPMMGGYYGGMGGYYGAGGIAGSQSGAGYANVRPGYEVRTLISSANILARRGQQDACETVLASARDIYRTYSAEMKNGTMPMGDPNAYYAEQLADATSVDTLTRSVRSDELLGTDVRSSKDEALGSVDDLVISPQSGEIAYLVISRGGFFGFDQKYVPVPWADFALTADGNFLVLDATTDMLKAAPQVDHNQVLIPDQFATVSTAVDEYWAKTLPPKAGN
jgi:sporulation protein YlmC with PRC-barrel domain